MNIRNLKDQPLDEIQVKKAGRQIKGFLIWLLKVVIIVGISYIILGPLITIVANSFFTANDLYNPVVMLLPAEGTLQNYITSFTRMTYPRTLATTFAYVISLTLIQIFICSMAGYGFARYEFPFKKVLFGCVILTIVIPNDTLMEVPMYIMTALGCGLRSGLYIYIFNQFFRGLPKEIEEAAVVDGAGSFYTYFRIMLVNAMPSVLTVSIFSLVWQYNDTFYAKLFSINSKLLMSMRISTLRASIEFIDQIKDTAVSQLYLYAGIVLMVIPIVIIYILLQKRFIGGASRSGIVV